MAAELERNPEIRIIEALSPSEMAMLANLEMKVHRNLMACHEAIEALRQINEKQFWRAEHASWEAYLKERWGVGDRRVFQLEDAASLVMSLLCGTFVPQNEAQARELGKFPEEIRPAVMEAAVEASAGRSSPDGDRYQTRGM